MAWWDLRPLFRFHTIRTRFQEFRTREVQFGSHTTSSHGYAVARTHKHDWVILLLLVLIEIILYIIYPFYRFVGKDMMTDLKYPLKSNTVPFWAVPMYAVLLPMVIFLVVYIRRRDVYDLHHAILGLLFSILVTAVITEALKDAVGRPRPDFFWRCFPDGKDDVFAGGLLVAVARIIKAVFLVSGTSCEYFQGYSSGAHFDGPRQFFLGLLGIDELCMLSRERVHVVKRKSFSLKA